jgi:predicted DNA-binding transcriptional regulator YafY
VERAEKDLVARLSEGIRSHGLVELEYLKDGEETPAVHLVEPYVIERELPHWYVHTWDRTRDAKRSFRLDRMKAARLTGEAFDPRDDFEPDRLSDARLARIHFSPAIARWRLERGTATPLADGSAVEETAVGSADWLVGEILSFRGEAIVLEPPDLRLQVAERARELARELGVSRLRARG